MWAVIVSLVLPLVAAQGAAPPFALKLVDQDIVDRHNALCLAGNAPGYYFRPGTAENRTKFKLHFEGGGWCYTPESCYWRLTEGSPFPGWLANSSVWPPLAEDMVSPFGLMAWDDEDTAGWTSVWLNYCDGSSFTSGLDEPVVFNGTRLWMRGRYILRAVLEDLDRRAGLLTSATDVILSGTSAGGLAAYLHAERVRDALPASARLVAAPDAGFFVDEPNAEGVRVFRADVQEGWAMYNASEGVNDACVAHYGAGKGGWRCFMAQYTAPFIRRVPLYVLNSGIDEASMGFILQIGCKLGVNDTGTCNATQVAAIAKWREAFLGVLGQYVFETPAHRDTAGSYITSCPQHEEVCRTQDWTEVRVRGRSDRDNFGAWLAGAPPARTRLIDGPWPNPTCQVLPQHGPC